MNGGVSEPLAVRIAKHFSITTVHFLFWVDSSRAFRAIGKRLAQGDSF